MSKARPGSSRHQPVRQKRDVRAEAKPAVPRADAQPDEASAWDNAVLEIVPDFYARPEWQAAATAPNVGQFGEPNAMASRGHIGRMIIRKLRDGQVRKKIVDGDRDWIALALSVIGSRHQWHQSGRIKLSAMRSLRQRLALDTPTAKQRQSLLLALENALLLMVDRGVGEEFKALTRVAKGVATAGLIAGLEQRASEAPVRSVRVNAQRMLDVVNGKPYRRYGIDL